MTFAQGRPYGINYERPIDVIVAISLNAVFMSRGRSILGIWTKRGNANNQT